MTVLRLLPGAMLPILYLDTKLIELQGDGIKIKMTDEPTGKSAGKIMAARVGKRLRCRVPLLTPHNQTVNSPQQNPKPLTITTHQLLVERLVRCRRMQRLEHRRHVPPLLQPKLLDQTLNPKPQTPNPKPQTPNLQEDEVTAWMPVHERGHVVHGIAHDEPS